MTTRQQLLGTILGIQAPSVVLSTCGAVISAYSMPGAAWTTVLVLVACVTVVNVTGRPASRRIVWPLIVPIGVAGSGRGSR